MPRVELHDLDATTPTYVDCYVALEVFHLSYPEYIQRIPRTERLFYQVFLAMKGLKEQRAHERQKEESELRRMADEGLFPDGARS
jgi:hypothetical protein